MTKKKKNKRWRVIADPNLQGMLCLRIVAYWIACQLVIYVTIFGFSNLEGPVNTASSVTRFFVPAAFVSFFVLPIALLDMLMFSNRFAGPVLNFRKKFASLVQKRETNEMYFRPGDYFPDLRENYNELCKLIDSKKEESAVAK